MKQSDIVRRAAWISAAILAGTISLPTSAYNISLKGRMHERMTVKAEQCLEASSGNMPQQCDIGEPGDKLRGRWRSPLAKATRWSDDPTNQAGPLGGVKFAYNMAFGGCDRAIRARPDGDSYFAGLLCNSHYGDFQFMHAMSTTSTETREQTINNMLAWADLSYGVATGRIGAEVEYCEQFSEGSAIDHLMKPDTFPFCGGIETDGDQSSYNPWRVYTLFSMRCRNPFSSVTCTEYIGDRGTEMARINATGALLHMVQDSYSQAHAVRGPRGGDEENGFDARIECKRVKAFYNFNEQMEEEAKHGQADKRPLFSSSCFEGGQINDPVTASAILLWHIDQDSDPAVVRKYLSVKVFG